MAHADRHEAELLVQRAADRGRVQQHGRLAGRGQRMCHQAAAQAPTAVSGSDQQHADRRELGAVARENRDASQITGLIAHPVDGADIEQEPPLAFLGQPLPVAGQREAAG